MVSLAICAASWLVYDVLSLFICICFATRTRFTRTRMIRTYSSYVAQGMTQNKDAVWFLVLLLDAWVRADPTYSYSYI